MVKTDRLFSSWPAGAVGVVGGGGGGGLYMDGNRYIYNVHYNLIIVNNRIIVIVWLNHLYGSQ